MILSLGAPQEEQWRLHALPPNKSAVAPELEAEFPGLKLIPQD